MKTNKINFHHQKLVLGLIILFIAGLSFLNVSGCMPDGDAEVQKAFELRMEGKVDEALELVNLALEEDSTNALANFEKYRILLYMMKGGADIPMKIDEITMFIEKAAIYDPDNVIIAYEKALAVFLKAYMGEGDDKEAVKAITDAFEDVLELQPGHPQSLLYLVEIYSQLPPDMGGDPEKAVKYAELFNKIDEYYAAKAELLINPQDELKFWFAYLDAHEKTPDLLEDIATAYIYEDDLANAEKYYNEVITLDPERNYLILNMARYYMYQVMSGQAEADSVLPLAANYINIYLESEPAPIIPMKAYAMSILGRTRMFTGQQEEGTELLEKARELDPYFSRASGLPGMSKFDPPNRIKPRYASFFRPF